MNQFYILEVQRYWDIAQEGNEQGLPVGYKTPGEFGHIVHFAYDADPTKARLKAESKYHEVLAAAAISELPQHSATLLTSDGRAVMNQVYRHDAVQPEVEPEPEEAVEE